MNTKLNIESIIDGSIEKGKLAESVQESLSKADAALQSYTEQYKGTVTGVKINGTTKSQTNGIVDLGTVITAHQTLKTINGESIVGGGDIVIEGGNVQAVDTGDVLDDVTVDYATTSYVDNKVANIDLTSYATTSYVDGLVGDINSILESIIGGDVTLIAFTIDDTEYQAEDGMTWEEWCNSEYNTNEFYTTLYGIIIDSRQIYNENTSVTYPKPSDTIINGHSYITLTTGGGQ